MQGFSTCSSLGGPPPVSLSNRYIISLSIISLSLSNRYIIDTCSSLGGPPPVSLSNTLLAMADPRSAATDP